MLWGKLRLAHISFQIKYNAVCISNYTIPRVVQLRKIVLYWYSIHDDLSAGSRDPIFGSDF